MSDEKKVWYGTLKKKLGTSETLCNSMTNIKVHKGNSGCRHRQPATARHCHHCGRRCGHTIIQATDDRAISCHRLNHLSSSLPSLSMDATFLSTSQQTHMSLTKATEKSQYGLFNHSKHRLYPDTTNICILSA